MEKVAHMQCDQIGLFLKGLGDKFSYKSSPNIWQLFGLFEKCYFGSLTTVLTFRSTFEGKLGNF